jgi:hypothetical protein
VRYIKRLILSYLEAERLYLHVSCLLPKRPNKHDIYKLACLAALHGYKPSDYDKMFKDQRACLRPEVNTKNTKT